MSQVLSDAFDVEFSKAEAPPRKLGAITDWFIDKIKKVAEASDLSKMSKEDFLAAVGMAYDKFVLPIDLPGPDAILDPLLKTIAQNAAGRIYDKFAAA